jgi:hypothetical protein
MRPITGNRLGDAVPCDPFRKDGPPRRGRPPGQGAGEYGAITERYDTGACRFVRKLGLSSSCLECPLSKCLFDYPRLEQDKVKARILAQLRARGSANRSKPG